MADPLLLIEDDDTTRELLTLLLEAENWQVTAAASGEEALSAIQPQTAVILSDLNLPGISGEQLATALKARVPQARLVAMTATQRDGIPQGYDQILIKPFDPKAVRAALSSTPAAEAIDPATFAKFQQAMPPAQLRALYDFALQDANTRIARLEAAAQQNDAATFRSEAHALKGSAAMIGATQLRDLAAAAETGQMSIKAKDFLPFHKATAQIRHILNTLAQEN